MTQLACISFAMLCATGVVHAQIVPIDYQVPAGFSPITAASDISTGVTRLSSNLFCYDWSFNGFSSGCIYDSSMSAFVGAAQFAESRLRTVAAQSGYMDVVVITTIRPPVAVPFGGVLYTGRPISYRYNSCPIGQARADSKCLPVRDLYTPPPTGACPKAGNPIYPMTGTKREPIETGVGLLSANLTIAFDSQRAIWGEQFLPLAGEVTFYGDLGDYWSSSLHRKLVASPNGQSIQIIRGDGSVSSFSGSDLSWTAAQGVKDSLIINGGNFLYRDQNALAIESYGSVDPSTHLGTLQSMVSSSGMIFTTANSTVDTPAATSPKSGYMLSLSDPFGRSVNFKYKSVSAPSGIRVVINQIIDPTGQAITANYDSIANLTTLTWQDNKVKTFVYDSPNLNQAWALTGVIDENSKRYSTFTYDANGWVKSTAHANGVLSFSSKYGNAPKPIVRQNVDLANNVVWRCHEWGVGDNAGVDQPNGSRLGMNFVAIPGDGSNGPSQCNLLRFGGYQQPGGSGCLASTSGLTYDSNGNVLVSDDFNGNRSCYAYTNSGVANLEKTKVEGLNNSNSCASALIEGTNLPAGSRRVSTKWHPNWALKVAQAEPLLLTTWVYNGQPDPFNGGQIANCTSPMYGASTVPLLPDGNPIAVLCKKVEQATLDTSGSQGLTPTLASSGSAPAPRQWSYTYNQYGQLLTSTDPLGHSATYHYYAATSFTGADPNAVGHYMGDLMDVTNAAGHVTSFTSYDKAGRVLSKTEPSGLITAYSYWPRGWPKAIKQCDSAPCDISTTTGGLLTNYVYWPTGLVKSVTSPDGSQLIYNYDDAHRLVGISDTAGNTVSYTLDNSGNRTAEQVKDAGGVLVRNITRAYDALNRLQSVTGAIQ